MYNFQVMEQTERNFTSKVAIYFSSRPLELDLFRRRRGTFLHSF